jgi:hypothetical protein
VPETIFRIIQWNDRKINCTSRRLTPFGHFRTMQDATTYEKSHPRGDLAAMTVTLRDRHDLAL